VRKKKERIKAPYLPYTSFSEGITPLSFEPKQTYLFVSSSNIFYIGSVLEMKNAFKKRKRF